MNWFILLFFVAVAGFGLRDLISGEVQFNRAPRRLTGIGARMFAAMVFLTGIGFVYWTLVNWNNL